MTKRQFELSIDETTKKCKEDNDPYFIVHFSRVDDHYHGWHEGLDEFDAMIVIKHLVKEFKLTKLQIESVL